MLTNVRISLRAGMRDAVSIALMLLVFATFAAACSDPEPTPTATPTVTPTPLPPTPTATPEPTPTPPPTATPEPAPDAMMPEPDGGSVEDLVITESTTLGDLMAVLSKRRSLLRTRPLR